MFDIVDFTNLNEKEINNGLYHFTSKFNLSSIKEHGLIPLNGPHSGKADKSTEGRIFFAKGAEGILEIFDVWIRWLEFMELQAIFLKDNLNSSFENFCISYINDILPKEEIKNIVFKKLKKLMDDSVYLKLDLEEGIDFKCEDVDENKSKYSKALLEKMYAKSSNIEEGDFSMDRWNMHTINGKVIEPSKLKIMSLDNDISIFNIVKNLYLNHPDLDIDYLDDYMNYYGVSKEKMFVVK